MEILVFGNNHEAIVLCVIPNCQIFSVVELDLTDVPGVGIYIPEALNKFVGNVLVE
jgi:hypothetical protein